MVCLEEAPPSSAALKWPSPALPAASWLSPPASFQDNRVVIIVTLRPENFKLPRETRFSTPTAHFGATTPAEAAKLAAPVEDGAVRTSLQRWALGCPGVAVVAREVSAAMVGVSSRVVIFFSVEYGTYLRM